MDFSDFLFRYGYYENEFSEVKEIGKGSFGVVFIVSDKNGDNYAIKTVKPLANYEKMFLREFQNYNYVNSFESEFCVTKKDSWFENKRDSTGLLLYIKMELCDKTLEDVMNETHSEFYKKENKILSPIGYFLISEIFIEILKGVSCLHKNNFIHRDLNLLNVLLKIELNGKISVKIADFGLSVLHEFSQQFHTQDRGTDGFIAPEVVNCNTYDTKADIYSLGIILERLFKINVNMYVKNLFINL
jgi:serine/threonine protein kinase